MLSESALPGFSARSRRRTHPLPVAERILHGGIYHMKGERLMRWNSIPLIGIMLAAIFTADPQQPPKKMGEVKATKDNWSAAVDENAQSMFAEGKRIFRFDTFGDEAYWSDTLRLHQAIEGEKFGGVGGGVSPKTALSVGLKIDAEAIPNDVADAIKKGQVNLDDP